MCCWNVKVVDTVKGKFLKDSTCTKTGDSLEGSKFDFSSLQRTILYLEAMIEDLWIWGPLRLDSTSILNIYQIGFDVYPW